MVNQFAATAHVAARSESRQRDVWLAVLGALAIVAVHAARGFPALVNSQGDNDSLMRMVQVLDLLSGQSWFDLHQYRMGPPGGFLMHWSRFVDAPIAVIILVARALTGNLDLAERVASVLWPALMIVAALYLVLKLVRRFGDEQAILPAVVVGTVTFYEMPLFQMNALDHHNVQLVLVLTMILWLLDAPRRPLAAAGAGVMASLSLVVGMETAPYVAVAGIVVALGYLVRGREERLSAAAFGLAFALVSLLSFVGTVPASLWAAPRCDAFTIPQMSIAMLGGLGLAAVALLPVGGATLRGRLAGLALVGAALAALLVVAFPQCLASPYAGLDPRLKIYWLDSVSEAQSFLAVLVKQPSKLAFYYATPFLAAAVVALKLRRTGRRRDLATFALFLLAAILVSLWQVRGEFFSVPFAVVPLAVWIAEWRARSAAHPGTGTSLRMAAAWLVSLNLVWGVGSAAAAVVFDRNAAEAQAASTADCYASADYRTLAEQPRGTVLAVSNLGASVLRFTPQRVLAGPYHRNVEGNLATLDAFMGTSDQARAVVRRYGVTMIAYCPGNAETPDLAALAPAGFMHQLTEGKIPAWLTPVPGTADQPLRLFTVGSP